MNILLVDDDEFLLDMYAFKFKSCGHTVTTAHTGVGALQVLSKTRDFDAVVLDMIMPGMSGTELIVAAREQHADISAKFIVLSNQGQEADIAEAKAAGASGYIIKAATIPSEVVERVEGIINNV